MPRCKSAISNWHSAIALACHVPAPCTHAVVVVAHLDADRMPLAVFRAARLVSQIVLLAQFVGDARRRGIEIVRVANDLRAAAAIVGHVAQRRDVDAIVRVAARTSAPSARAASAASDWRERAGTTAAAPARKRKRKRRRQTRWRRLRTHGVALSVDADRVHEHFGLANETLHL